MVVRDTMSPEEAAATSAMCDRTSKQKQTVEQDVLKEDVAHIFGREPTFHELSLFRMEGPPMKRVEDHGYLYGITEEEIAGCSEAVKRALSTHTAGVAESRRFRLKQVVDKFKLAEFDTGSSRVQGEFVRPTTTTPHLDHVLPECTWSLSTVKCCIHPLIVLVVLLVFGVSVLLLLLSSPPT